MNLTTTYVQVTAGLSSDIHAIQIASSGAIAGVPTVVEIATGAAASEVVVANIVNGAALIPLRIGANTRIAIRAVVAGPVNTGQISITMLQKA